MSRKTRKEKIIAKLRRELKKGTTSTPLPDSLRNLKQADKRKPKKLVTKQVMQISSKHIMSDLKKTAILSILAIGLELSLYYYLR